MTKENRPTKKQQLKEYEKYLEEAGKLIVLTPNDLSNLFDLAYMIDNPPELDIDVIETLKINKMYKWLWNLHSRIGEIVLAEKKDRDKVLEKLKKDLISVEHSESYKTAKNAIEKLRR